MDSSTKEINELTEGEIQRREKEEKSLLFPPRTKNTFRGSIYVINLPK